MFREALDEHSVGHPAQGPGCARCHGGRGRHRPDTSDGRLVRSPRAMLDVHRDWFAMTGWSLDVTEALRSTRRRRWACRAPPRLSRGPWIDAVPPAGELSDRPSASGTAGGSWSRIRIRYPGTAVSMPHAGRVLAVFAYVGEPALGSSHRRGLTIPVRGVNPGDGSGSSGCDSAASSHWRGPAWATIAGVLTDHGRAGRRSARAAWRATALPRSARRAADRRQLAGPVVEARRRPSLRRLRTRTTSTSSRLCELLREAAAGGVVHDLHEAVVDGDSCSPCPALLVPSPGPVRSAASSGQVAGQHAELAGHARRGQLDHPLAQRDAVRVTISRKMLSTAMGPSAGALSRARAFTSSMPPHMQKSCSDTWSSLPSRISSKLEMVSLSGTQLAREARELRGDEERLRQELLDPAGARTRRLVVLGELRPCRGSR